MDKEVVFNGWWVMHGGVDDNGFGREVVWKALHGQDQWMMMEYGWI